MHDWSMARPSKAASGKGATPRDAFRESGGFDYRDFKIHIKRRDAKFVTVQAVSDSGATAEAAKVAFPDTEVRAIHELFRGGFEQERQGYALITQAEAAELGK